MPLRLGEDDSHRREWRNTELVKEEMWSLLKISESQKLAKKKKS
jgi:hypothetical protein